MGQMTDDSFQIYGVQYLIRVLQRSDEDSMQFVGVHRV